MRISKTLFNSSTEFAALELVVHIHEESDEYKLSFLFFPNILTRLIHCMCQYYRTPISTQRTHMWPISTGNAWTDISSVYHKIYSAFSWVNTLVPLEWPVIALPRQIFVHHLLQCKLKRNGNHRIILLQSLNTHHSLTLILEKCAHISYVASCNSSPDDDVIKWKHLSHYWPFVRGIHRSLVNFLHKGQWRGLLIFYVSAPEYTVE